MPIYEKSTRMLLREMVGVLSIEKGETFPKEKVIGWFKANYPKIKEGTISAHLIKMSTNATSRAHYKASPVGEDDLLYQIDGSHFRLYDPERDPQPIYENRTVVLKNHRQRNLSNPVNLPMKET